MFEILKDCVLTFPRCPSFYVVHHRCSLFSQLRSSRYFISMWFLVPLTTVANDKARPSPPLSVPEYLDLITCVLYWFTLLFQFTCFSCNVNVAKVFSTNTPLSLSHASLISVHTVTSVSISGYCLCNGTTVLNLPITCLLHILGGFLTRIQDIMIIFTF